MATSSILVDIRANTQRALNDFKSFSTQLDNKFLVSGLKLDVVRNALSQINREFQKAIGEQGVTAGQSLRAAENQAAAIFSTFKSLGFETALEVSKSFSEQLNKAAVTIGSTMEDVKKAQSIVPWLDINLPKQVREDMMKQLLQIQTDFRNAGVGDNFGDLIRQFITKEISAEGLANSGDTLANMLGVQLQKIGGQSTAFMSPAARTEIVRKLLENKELFASISETAKETAGYKIVLTQLKQNLFNPKAGIFGALREVSMGAEQSTNITKETYKLVMAVFGPEGTFYKFFKAIGKIVGIDDPDEALRPVIKGIRWITKQFENISEFLESPFVEGITTSLRNAFKSMQEFALNLYGNTGEFLQSSKAQEIGQSLGDTFGRVSELITTLVKGFSSFLTTNGGAIAEKAGKVLNQFIKLFGSIVEGVVDFINSPVGTKLGATISRTINTFLNVFLGIVEALSKTETLNALTGNVTRAFDNVLNLFNAVLDVFDSGKLDSSSINESIGKIGTDVRSFIENLGQGLRDTLNETREDQGSLGSIINKIVEELGETVGTLFRQLFWLVVENLPQIIGGVMTAIGAGLRGFFTGLFDNEGLGNVAGIIASIGLGGWFIRALRLKFLNPLLEGVIGLLSGRGGVLGAINRMLGGGGGDIRGGPLRRTGQQLRRVSTPLLARGMAASAIAGEFLSTQAGRARDAYARFTAPRSAFPRPGTDLNLLRRRQAIREGRITADTSVLAGTIDEYMSPEDILARSMRPGGRITPETTMFKPPSPGELWPGLAIYDDENNPKIAAARQAERMRKYAEDAKFLKDIRDPRSVRQRFAQRYGRGALLRNQLGGQLGRLRDWRPPGGRFGAALSILGVGSTLLNAGRANASQDEFGQMIPEPKVGTGEAWGALGAGAAQGAMAGSVFGPLGTAIGGVIGGGMALMDSGVRDAVGKSIADFTSGLGKSIQELWTKLSEGGQKFIGGILQGLGKAATSMVEFFTKTLPSWWLRGMQTIYIELPKKLLDFVKELGVGLVKSVTEFNLGNAISGLITAAREKLTGQRALGGSVFGGGTYLVGENGPELFSPISNGTIIPNRSLSSSSSSSSRSNVSMTYNITVNGGGNAQEIASMVRAEIQRSWESAMAIDGPTGATYYRG